MYEHPLTGKIVEELDRFSHLQPEEGFRRHEWTAGAKNALVRAGWHFGFQANASIELHNLPEKLQGEECEPLILENGSTMSPFATLPRAGAGVCRQLRNANGTAKHSSRRTSRSCWLPAPPSESWSIGTVAPTPIRCAIGSTSTKDTTPATPTCWSYTRARQTHGCPCEFVTSLSGGSVPRRVE